VIKKHVFWPKFPAKMDVSRAESDGFSFGGSHVNLLLAGHLRSSGPTTNKPWWMEGKYTMGCLIVRGIGGILLF
jgi:hypothetical protein